MDLQDKLSSTDTAKECASLSDNAMDVNALATIRAAAMRKLRYDSLEASSRRIRDR